MWLHYLHDPGGGSHLFDIAFIWFNLLLVSSVSFPWWHTIHVPLFPLSFHLPCPRSCPCPFPLCYKNLNAHSSLAGNLSSEQQHDQVLVQRSKVSLSPHHPLHQPLPLAFYLTYTVSLWYLGLTKDLVWDVLHGYNPCFGISFTRALILYYMVPLQRRWPSSVFTVKT